MEEIGVHSTKVGSDLLGSVLIGLHTVSDPFHQLGSVGDGLLSRGVGRIPTEWGAWKGFPRWTPERGRDHLPMGWVGLGLYEPSFRS